MIVYLHGFNSGSASAKGAWLRRHLPDLTVLSPSYPAHIADDAVQVLRQFLERARTEHGQEKRLLLVGSSMGGFWSRYLAPELGDGMVLINPAMHPETDLLEIVGPQKNLATGEEYELTREQVIALGKYQVPKCSAKVPTLVLLDEGDELLDYREAEAYYRDCGEVIVYPGGSHRFDHLEEALPEIRAFYESL